MGTTRIAAIGVSAGGLRALKEFFSSLPQIPDLAFVVVTHLPRDTPSSLQPTLSAVTSLPVYVLQGQTVPRAGNIYVLPAYMSADLHEGVISVYERHPSEPVFKAIDEFLFSLATDQRKNAIAIILSGMGNDGARGVQAIQKCGGMVLAQDPESSKYSSMPRAAIDADQPEEIAAPHLLGQTLSLMLQGTSNYSQES
ncbi:chemotaxis protein CheB [Fulvivirgaceae bacterium PWU5]|uniref:protein-glutamate methylesterase n=1 Tax=Dawidia cretensis TaxID=2782350 RepID=A0AAP2DX02_9BACT|nr:chemotaxis protein CheB [Dawidia cretensis]MBT1707919.1 chemotaxis protein CheB [Dawidia cretensis]